MNQCANNAIKIKKVVNFVKFAKRLEIIVKKLVEIGLIAKNVKCGFIKNVMMQLRIHKNLKKLVYQLKNIFVLFVEQR